MMLVQAVGDAPPARTREHRVHLLRGFGIQGGRFPCARCGTPTGSVRADKQILGELKWSWPQIMRENIKINPVSCVARLYHDGKKPGAR